MKAEEQLRIHQLLGRIVYFHCLFIEPNAGMTAPAAAVHRNECCRHTEQYPNEQYSGPDLATTAWAVLPDLTGTTAAASPPHRNTRNCCAACQVRDAGTDITQAWITVESGAYGRASPQPTTTRAWAQLAGRRISAAFITQHPAQCTRVRTEPEPGPAALPNPDELPITAELLALWADPTSDSAPVVSWLNHCSTLADVGRVIQSRRTPA